MADYVPRGVGEAASSSVRGFGDLLKRIFTPGKPKNQYEGATGSIDAYGNYIPPQPKMQMVPRQFPAYEPEVLTPSRPSVPAKVAEAIVPQITKEPPTFMDRRGAFTGPNNDPNTPGMQREAPRETELPTYYEDDARYKKGQGAIAERESAANTELRRAMAGSERAGVTAGIENRRSAEQQRQRQNQLSDTEEAFRADERRMKLDMLKEEMRRRNQWSAERGGMPWSAEAEAEDYKRELDRGIAVEGEGKIRAANSDETRYIAGLDGLSQGMIPNDPELIAKLEEITGTPISQISIAPRDIEILKTKIRSEAERERTLARDTWMSLLKLMKTNKSEKDSEFSGG